MTLSPKLTPPTKSSTSAEWISWYDELKATFGKRDAATAFSKAWNLRGSSKANTSDFRGQMKDRGIVISADNLAGVALDEVNDFGDFVGNLFSMGKTFAIGTAVVFALLIIIVVWRLATPQTVAMVTKAAV